MQQVDPQMLAAIIAMMQQQASADQSPTPQTSYTMPPEPPAYSVPYAATGAGALGGAGFGAQLGGLPGAAIGAGVGGALGLATNYGMAQGAPVKGTTAYNNEYGDFEQPEQPSGLSAIIRQYLNRR